MKKAQPNLPIFVWDDEVADPGRYRRQLPELLTGRGLKIDWEEVLRNEFIQNSTVILPKGACLVLNQEVYSFEQMAYFTRKSNRFSPRLFLGKLLHFSSLLLIAVFPKCPICWAAYAGMFGSLGLANISYKPGYVWIPIAIMAGSLFFVFRYTRLQWSLSIVYVIGLIMILGNHFYWSIELLNYLGIGLLLIASFSLAASKDMVATIRYFVKRKVLFPAF